MGIAISQYDILFPLDVDKKRIHVVVMDKDRLIKKVSLPYDPENLLSFARRNFGGRRGLFVYEAGPTGYGLYDYLKEQGEDCEVAVPSMIPKAPGQRVKTNRLDAYNLGLQVRTGELKVVHVPEKKYRDLRHLTRLRLKERKRIIGIKNGLKGLYLFEGIQFPAGAWSRRLISQIKQINCRPTVEFKVREMIEELDFFRRQELKVRAEIKRLCRADGELDRCIDCIRSLPGVDWIVSTYVLGALGGYKHLSSAKRTSGFLGFGARENSTGEQVRRGRITAVGDPAARKMIIQASWVGIRRDEELRAIYDGVLSRNPEQFRRQKAIVAVGRKNVCRIHAVLRDQRHFEKREKKAADQKEQFAPGSLDSRRVRRKVISPGTSSGERGPGAVPSAPVGVLNSV